MAQETRKDIGNIVEKLTQHGQQHITSFFEELSDPVQQEFVEQLQELDLPLIDKLITKYVRNNPQVKLPGEILPPPVYPIKPRPELEQKYQQAEQKGRQLISEGKVAAFVVAGGMGTRLNFDGPKGCFPATPIKAKSLFEVFAEIILAAKKRYAAKIPWYIMTSRANHAATIQAFEQNNYYSLNPESVIMFEQGMMPSFDPQGKILLSGKGQLALSPDGHGGSLRALYKSGAIADMQQRGVEQISYFQVDNPLNQIIDPLFIGLHALDQAQMSSKAVIKCEPLERVGNFTLINGKVTVIEYSDLPSEMATRKNADGSYVFELGSIAIHVIQRQFVEQLNRDGFSLPWHRAVKKVPYVDAAGNFVDPTEPNAVKLETFVFDALPLAEKSIILAIDRDEEFAPIKNAAGSDSPASSQRLQIDRAARWLEKARVKVPRQKDGSVDAVLEISPLFALDQQELIEKRQQIPPLKPGQSYYLG
ncbi:MAG: UDPGP type 1 family protein [Sedimentisphaerales bacterium]|nr:UDPGP type 1 family protein [Sedimentisphaerales bacterium]